MKFIADVLEMAVHIKTELAVLGFMSSTGVKFPSAFKPVCLHERIIIHDLLMLLFVGDEINHSDAINMTLREIIFSSVQSKAHHLIKNPWLIASPCWAHLAWFSSGLAIQPWFISISFIVQN